MRKLLSVLLLSWFSCVTGSALADQALLVKSNCLACHLLDKRKYGPKLNEISSKYVNDANALDKLAKKIKDGGTGVWGEDVMPPQPQLSDADALALAKYILSLK
ncbi:MAG: cytochrome C' [Burkholderiales bacterium]|nr:MAG: cytochrome C' [Betaproteobacteria bacterium]TAG25438.1 MAG: cytochrome C' [Burkholderiales bacterium]